ncbi:hypothetical protein D9601_02555 [Sphingomonas sp. MA1305]|uniref:hypothetical protein n=1 Tax=Sphingomonas sp. MA1305 TaxID=2479204 RepID=UPI0018E00A3F|nr:hypothetical protein [Sphingomonas sp. MA1305]MBI0474246.1 hypothetical protein [Sphingomonas sp. MA1305]
MTHLPSPAGWSGDTAALSLDQIKDMAIQLGQELPAAKLVELLRELASNLSWSNGIDDIDRGLDAVADDLRTEEERTAANPWHFPTLPILTQRPVSLNPDAWRA